MRPGVLAAEALLLSSVLLAAPVPEEKWVAPPEAAERVNPLAPGPAVARKGAALFTEHCAMCHGDGGRGDGPSARLHAARAKPPEDLTKPEVQARLTDGEMFWKITTGWRLGGRVIMPRFDEKLPEPDDRWSLVHHVRALADPRR